MERQHGSQAGRQASRQMGTDDTSSKQSWQHRLLSAVMLLQPTFAA